MYRSDESVKAMVSIQLDKSLLSSIEKALKPETETPSSDRSNTIVEIKDDQLVISTEASDTSALRASLNSYLRWVEGIQGIMDGLE